MSLRGFFEINPSVEVETLLAGVRSCGFPAAEYDKAWPGLKPVLIDLQAFQRPDGGVGAACAADLTSVAKYLLLKALDGEVVYFQDLDLRNPTFQTVLTPDDVARYPPSLSGHEGILIVRAVSNR